MHVDRYSFSLSVSIAALVVGCAGSPAPVPPDAPVPGSKPAAASPAPAPEGVSAAQEPDTTADETPTAAASPSFATLLAAAMACPTDEDGEFDSSCEGYAQWGEDSPAFEGGKANPDLVRMLGSKDAKERRLAAEKLRGTLDEENLDAATASAVLDAAEKERDTKLIGVLAGLAGELNLVKTGTLDRAIAISKAHPEVYYTESFLLAVGHVNRDPKLVAYAVKVSKNKAARLRNAALEVLTKLAGDFPAETCKEINALRSDKDAFVANRATSSLARNKCPAYVDKLLDALSAVNVKKDVDQGMGYALNDLCAKKDLSPAQRSRANKAARRISEAPAVQTNTRYYTLSAVMGCDPENGAAFVSKYKSDKDAIIAKRAAELTQ